LRTAERTAGTEQQPPLSLCEEALLQDGHVGRLTAAPLATSLKLRVELPRSQVDGVGRRSAIRVKPISERFHLLTVVKHVLRHLHTDGRGAQNDQGARSQAAVAEWR